VSAAGLASLLRKGGFFFVLWEFDEKDTRKAECCSYEMGDKACISAKACIDLEAGRKALRGSPFAMQVTCRT
jgi:hypothetical protein